MADYDEGILSVTATAKALLAVERHLTARRFVPSVASGRGKARLKPVSATCRLMGVPRRD